MDITEKLLNGRIVIHCDTEEKAKNLLSYLDSKGFKWISGVKPTDYTNWWVYTKDTCYRFSIDRKFIFFSDYKDYESEDYEIISYEEFMKGYIMERKETNFEHYKETIEEIAKQYTDSAEMCAEIIEVFDIKRGACTNYFEDVFAWGMSEYEPVREMTIKEISKILGYKVKIVEE